MFQNGWHLRIGTTWSTDRVGTVDQAFDDTIAIVERSGCVALLPTGGTSVDRFQIEQGPLNGSFFLDQLVAREVVQIFAAVVRFTFLMKTLQIRVKRDTLIRNFSTNE